MRDHFFRSVGISSGVIVTAFALGAFAIFFMNGRLGERVARIADARARIVQRAEEVKRLADLKRDAPKAGQYERAIDILLPDINQLAELYIAVLDTGAYQDPLASHHCLLSSPLKLSATNGELKIARARERPEDVSKLFGW